MKKILIIAGEASGDLHGSALISELNRIYPELEFFGIGGDKMRQKGVMLYYHLNKLAFMGFWEVLKNLSLIREVMNGLAKVVEERKPDLAVLIDYPGFNLRFAKELKKRNIPIVYYISPQIWAWGGKRIKKIKNLVDKMIVVFPFEVPLYQNAGVPVEFVGHPLLEVAKPTLSETDFKNKINLKRSETLLGIFPGSRVQEVKKILPLMLETAQIVKARQKELKVALGLAPTIERSQIEEIIGNFHIPVEIVRGLTYDLMKYSDLLLVASGTATLEAAILETPLIVLYKTSWLTWVLAKNLVKIPHIALVNVVAGKKIVPEFLQNQAVPKEIASEVFDILNNKSRSEAIKEELAKVKNKLGESKASTRAAKLIAEFLEGKKPEIQFR